METRPGPGRISRLGGHLFELKKHSRRWRGTLHSSSSLGHDGGGTGGGEALKKTVVGSHG